MASPSATDMRALAEAVNGQRDTDLIIATDASGDLVSRTALQPGDSYLFTVRTNSRQRRPAAFGSISAGELTSPLDGCDAVFWTEAAVEKFVWPYYEAHGIDVQDFRQAYESDASIIGVAHTFPTVPKLIRAGDSGIQLLTGDQYAAQQGYPAPPDTSDPTPGLAAELAAL